MVTQQTTPLSFVLQQTELSRESPRAWQRADLEGGSQAVQVLGHAAGVIGGGTADALDHVHTIAAFAAHTAVVLRAAEVHAALRHLRVDQPVHAPGRNTLTASHFLHSCAAQLA